MNIRNLTNPISSVENVRKSEFKDVKTDVSSEDRDADGRRQQEEPSKDPLSENEFKLAEEYLQNLTGLKSNGLSIEVESKGELRIFLIKDQEGHVVRRIVEWEMRLLLNEKEKKTGQIFDKSA